MFHADFAAASIYTDAVIICPSFPSFEKRGPFEAPVFHTTLIVHENPEFARLFSYFFRRIGVRKDFLIIGTRLFAAPADAKILCPDHSKYLFISSNSRKNLENISVPSEERPGSLVFGRKHFFRSSFFHDHAVCHKDHPVGNIFGKCHLMGHDHHRDLQVCRDRMTFNTSPVNSGSRAEVGSSKNRILGFSAKALAMATR